MIELLTFILVSHGMTQILVYGSIFDKVRPKEGFFGELLGCPMCTGFWVGVFLWGINPLTALFTYDLSVVTGFMLGCLSSGTCYLLSVALQKLEFINWHMTHEEI